MERSRRHETRHIEVLPQRTYVALLELPPGYEGELEFELDGKPATRLVLPSVEGPGSTSERAKFHYVRLSEGEQPWRTSARVLYANDETGSLREPELPYVLGGRCVRTPSPELMPEYHDAGLPESVTHDELINLYTQEGLVVEGVTLGADTQMHVLEGGNALYTPPACSAGFARLYCAEHEPYEIRTESLRELYLSINGDGGATQTTGRPIAEGAAE